MFSIEKGSVKIIGVQVLPKVNDAPTITEVPTIEKLSYTSFEAVVHIEDADGVRNLACQLQTPE